VAVDVRRVLKYPPESFLSATPVDLRAGENRVAEYVGFEPNIIVVQGLSFYRTPRLRFSMDADGTTDAVRLDDLSSAKGLDFEELVKMPASRSATMKISSPSDVSAYAWRHRVTVFRPTALLKMQMGLSLTSEESELAERYGLSRLLSIAKTSPYDLFEGIEEWRVAATALTTSGTVCRVLVPRGKKVVLACASASRPSPASAYLVVNRDGLDEVLRLDLSCLPSLDWDACLRIVSLERLEVELDVRAAGEYRVRVSYGIGRVTIPEKIRWGLDLTREERRLAEEEDLYDKVRAGLA